MCLYSPTDFHVQIGTKAMVRSGVIYEAGTKCSLRHAFRCADGDHRVLLGLAARKEGSMKLALLERES